MNTQLTESNLERLGYYLQPHLLEGLFPCIGTTPIGKLMHRIDTILGSNPITEEFLLAHVLQSSNNVCMKFADSFYPCIGMTPMGKLRDFINTVKKHYPVQPHYIGDNVPIGTVEEVSIV
jgi:hypothetical protein